MPAANAQAQTETAGPTDQKQQQQKTQGQARVMVRGTTSGALPVLASVTFAAIVDETL